MRGANLRGLSLNKSRRRREERRKEETLDFYKEDARKKNYTQRRARFPSAIRKTRPSVVGGRVVGAIPRRGPPN